MDLSFLRGHMKVGLLSQQPPMRWAYFRESHWVTVRMQSGEPGIVRLTGETPLQIWPAGDISALVFEGAELHAEVKAPPISASNLPSCTAGFLLATQAAGLVLIARTQDHHRFWNDQPIALESGALLPLSGIYNNAFAFPDWSLVASTEHGQHSIFSFKA